MCVKNTDENLLVLDLRGMWKKWTIPISTTYPEARATHIRSRVCNLIALLIFDNLLVNTCASIKNDIVDPRTANDTKHLEEKTDREIYVVAKIKRK